VLLEVAKQLGGDLAKALPFITFVSMLKAAFVPLRAHKGSVTAETDDDFWQAAQTQGGWWSAPAQAGSIGAANKSTVMGKQVPATVAAPEFAGSATDFPFNFQPFVTPSFGDGSAAHLPWMQELPDVLTTAMWSSWVEINTKTGEKLGIQQGDLVEITSQAGSLRVAAVLSPGIAPDLLAVPVGQGHESFGRFASGIGANPLSILASVVEHDTGSLAWAATRVKLARVGGPEQAKLVLYAGGMSRFPHQEEPR
jgi:anaerobic selenocysteine-containing dehydrogenase